jgi:hypothetical protein
MPFYDKPLKLYRDGQQDGPDPSDYPYAWQNAPKWLGDESGDLDWLQSQYGAPVTVRCAILYGNEDSATRIEGWNTYNPDNGTPPDWTYDAPKED